MFLLYLLRQHGRALLPFLVTSLGYGSIPRAPAKTAVCLHEQEKSVCHPQVLRAARSRAGVQHWPGSMSRFQQSGWLCTAPHQHCCPCHNTATMAQALRTHSGANDGDRPAAPHALQVCKPQGPVSRKTNPTDPLTQSQGAKARRGGKLSGAGHQARTKKGQGVQNIRETHPDIYIHGTQQGPLVWL